MQTKIDKSALVAILTENRDKHRAIFLEAVEGYRNEAVKQLEDHLRRVKDGTMVQVQVYLPVPEQHTHDYERVIRMVELHTEDTITLTESDVAQYVMDDWAWKRQFLASNSSYSATAAASLGD